MKSNVALIGFMGTGKSAVGKALAKKLGKQPVELDTLIEQQSGKSIADIFLQDGEIAFRELEIAVTKEVAKRKDQVIACGGGLVLNKINIDRLQENAVIVYLTAAPGTILSRVSATADKGTRPLLKGDNPAATVTELLAFREPFYQRAADITMDTSNLDVASVVEQIIESLKNNASFNQ